MFRTRMFAAALTGLVSLGIAPVAHATLYPNWTSTGPTSTSRWAPAAAGLAGGDALAVGGRFGYTGLRTVERFNGLTKQWSLVASLNQGRAGARAVTLGDGKVLVAGGNQSAVAPNPAMAPIASTELYDPVADVWSTSDDMDEPRSGFALQMLDDGRVLAVGGYPLKALAAGAEIYEPLTGEWTATQPVQVVRAQPASVRLADGRVLVAGGYDGTSENASAELFNPADRTWTAVASMHEARSDAAAALLADGRVLVASGVRNLHAGGYPTASNTFEIYDPATDAWTAPSPLLSRHGGGAALSPLSDGRLVLTGGYATAGGGGTITEIFTPASGVWTAAPAMDEPRDHHLAIAFPDDSVLVTGGITTKSQRLTFSDTPPVVETPTPTPTPTATATPTVTPDATPSPTPTPQGDTPQPPAKPKASTGRVTVKATTVTVPVTCVSPAATSCRVSLKLTVTQKQRKTTVASKTVTVPAGKTQKVALALNAKGKRLVKTRPLKAKLSVDGTAKQTLTFRKTKR